MWARFHRIINVSDQLFARPNVGVRMLVVLIWTFELGFDEGIGRQRPGGGIAMEFLGQFEVASYLRSWIRTIAMRLNENGFQVPSLFREPL